MKPAYLCDYQQYAECRKTVCAWNPLAARRACYASTQPEVAVKDERGEPIRVNLEGIKKSEKENED